MIRQFGGEGKLVAVVSDSYDLQNAVAEHLGRHAASQRCSRPAARWWCGPTPATRSAPGEVLKDLADAFGAAQRQGLPACSTRRSASSRATA